MPAFLAVDWGTSNLRAWVVQADGSVGAHEELPLGVSRLQPGEAQRRFEDEVRPALHAEGLPALMAGMIGSTLGWVEAPYLDCPADAAALGRALVEVAPGVRIAPGLRCIRPDGAPDVMRGEETQIIGWLAQGAERRRGVRIVCHPGTHAKWVRVEDGRVTGFVTMMTGELFDTLSKHSVLKSEDGPTPDPAADDAAFDLGVDAAGEGDALSARLFTARSRVVGGDMPKAAARSYLSGLLIGADVASGPRMLGADPAPGGPPLALVGDAALCGLYARALARRGMASETFSGEDAVLSGLRALFDQGEPR